MKSANVTSAAQKLAPAQKLVCCAVQEEEFCFALSEVRSLTRAQPLATSASGQEGASGTPAPLGWLTLQQEQLPVYELAERLQLAPSPTVQTAAQTADEGFFVALNTTPAFAVRVDRIMGSVELPNAQLLALPAITRGGTKAIFKGIAQVKDKWVFCADAQQLHPTPATGAYASPSCLTTVEASFTLAANLGQAQRTAAPQIVLFSPASPSKEGMPILFGLSMTQVQEVTAVTPIMPVPHAPPYVLGITNWRGLPVPIVDLETRLGRTVTSVAWQASAAQSRLLVACGPEQRGLIGMLVHPQVKTLRLPIPYTTVSQPLVAAPEFIKGAFAWEGRPLVIPDVDAMLKKAG